MAVSKSIILLSSSCRCLGWMLSGHHAMFIYTEGRKIANLAWKSPACHMAFLAWSSGNTLEFCRKQINLLIPKNHRDLCQVVVTITAFRREICTSGSLTVAKFSVKEYFAPVVQDAKHLSSIVTSSFTFEWCFPKHTVTFKHNAEVICICFCSGHCNNIHCLAKAINQIAAALFTIHKGSIEDRLKEFLAVCITSFLEWPCPKRGEWTLAP